MLTKFTGDLDIIAALDDQPNDVGGLTAAQLKAKFDAGPKAIAAYINDTLTEELDGVTLPAEGTGILEKTADGVAWTTPSSGGGTGNPNILLNWYLADPINQRQVTTVSAGYYGPDCWKSFAGPPFELTSEGFRLPDKTMALQYIPLTALKVGSKYTMSVKLAHAVEHVGSGWSRKGGVQIKRFSSPYASTNLASFNPTEEGISSFTFTVTASDCLYYGFNIDAGKDYVTSPMVVEAVKLEEGEVSTLGMDAKPDPALELLRCQTRFQLYADATLCPSSRYEFRPVMQAEPTISTLTIGGVTYTTASCDI